MLPYHQAIRDHLPSAPGSGHAGLWFERFFNGYNQDFSNVENQSKQRWLQMFNRRLGDADALFQMAVQQYQLTQALGGECLVFKTDWHFVTGMGYPHPVENGLSWHAIQGVPYLTGASIKGMLRAWVEQWGVDTQDDPAKRQQLLNWFGSDHKNPKQQKTSVQGGQVIFFDALPIGDVQLKTDIMTPHMGKWYEKGGKIKDIVTQPEAVPADWHDPTPIPFLVVKNAAFLVSFAPASTCASDAVDNGEVAQSLIDAFEWLGAGAKTAVGYGQMSLDKMALNSIRDQVDQIAKAQETAKAEALMTPLELEINEIERSVNDLPIALLQALEKGHWKRPEDQKTVAMKIRSLWQKEKRWIPEFSGKNKSRVKQKNRCIKVMAFLS